jgi:DNA transformation protein
LLELTSIRHCERSEAIQRLIRSEWLDCFVASAPRNDVVNSILLQFARVVDAMVERVTALDTEFIRDLFAQFRPVTVRRMFSGAGLYCDGAMFGLVVRGTIYLKADESSSADFVREGSTRFTYTRGKASGRPSEHALPYWRLPDRLYDDPEELALWAERALAIAQRQKFKPPKQAKRRRARMSATTKNSVGRRRSQA